VITKELTVTAITFKTTVESSDQAKGELIKLPKEQSLKLPSRGTVMVEGTLNAHAFTVALEPDGQGSHWFAVGGSLGVKNGDEAAIELKPTKLWPEPEVPADIKKALAADPEAQAHWEDITPMARWDWLRWVDTVKQAETRKLRPQKLCSMLKAGKRRPCCFNRAMFTKPKVASI
jgi:hypothetical protein